ncbi:MAG: YesL family protein [Lachnospiraceae bacterium]|nr:YesL family protein [Lachnospiraceae bacterium]
MRNLLDQDGPVMRALSDLSTLVFLNILTLLFCIPVVTAGASLAAMHYLIIEMIEERGSGLVREFMRRFKENLKNATPIWLILLAAALFLYADYRIIDSGMAGLPKWTLIPIYAGAFAAAAIYVYVIPLTARFVYSTSAAFRNAAILAAAYLPRTILMAAVTVVIPYILLNVTRLLPLFFILGFSFPAYLCALMYTPIFDKMIGKTEEEERPWVLEAEEPAGEGGAAAESDTADENTAEGKEE